MSNSSPNKKKIQQHIIDTTQGELKFHNDTNFSEPQFPVWELEVMKLKARRYYIRKEIISCLIISILLLGVFALIGFISGLIESGLLTDIGVL